MQKRYTDTRIQVCRQIHTGRKTCIQTITQGDNDKDKLMYIYKDIATDKHTHTHSKTHIHICTYTHIFRNMKNIHRHMKRHVLTNTHRKIHTKMPLYRKTLP